MPPPKNSHGKPLWVPEPPKPTAPQALVGRLHAGHMMVNTCDTVAHQVVSHHFSHDAGKSARLFRTPYRCVWPSELDLMARLAGFALERRHADWNGSAFTEASSSHVSVYRLT